MKIAVSACLIGVNCKYNGGNNDSPAIHAFLSGHEILPVCPEILAGAGIPRKCVELRDGYAVNCDGACVDAAYREGARLALRRVLEFGPSLAILKSRSPTCGVRQIYDGTFTGRRIPGMGIFARMLKDAGIPVCDSDDLECGKEPYNECI